MSADHDGRRTGSGEYEDETTEPRGNAPADLLGLLVATREQDASDLLLTPGAPPCLRVDGRLAPMKGPSLGTEDTRRLCRAMMTEAQQGRLEAEGALRFSFGVRDVARFRAQIFLQRGALAGQFRRVPFEVRPLGSLRLPPAAELVGRVRGLVLFSSAAREGKSTTMAAAIDRIAAERAVHVLTLEDPIEYLHRHQKSLVDQIELDTDVPAARALELACRADADVVAFGDVATPLLADAAVTLAESGRLVLACVAATSGAGALSRLLELAPQAAGASFGRRVARSLSCVVHQALLPRASGAGRVPAFEIVNASESVRAALRDGSIHGRTGFEEDAGAHPLDRSIDALVEAGEVRREAS